ncbi:hypothetical protein [Hoeflea olei]|uniref:Uncharacterized protein n=1 Tax=Hoeflea olei TaxID=1480615 RepID=A0A1C1YTI5_9HYPH|nr:hypothetical protein [Hoeflea olei]OCW56804.1 hypothetical protein AWJ14_17965 [Hoeflea olei]
MIRYKTLPADTPAAPKVAKPVATTAEPKAPARAKGKSKKAAKAPARDLLDLPAEGAGGKD